MVDDGTLPITGQDNRPGSRCLKASDWIGAVPHDVAQADQIGHVTFGDVLKHRIKRFQVGMDVTEDGQHVGSVATRTTEKQNYSAFSSVTIPAHWAKGPTC